MIVYLTLITILLFSFSTRAYAGWCLYHGFPDASEEILNKIYGFIGYDEVLNANDYHELNALVPIINTLMMYGITRMLDRYVELCLIED